MTLFAIKPNPAVAREAGNAQDVSSSTVVDNDDNDDNDILVERTSGKSWLVRQARAQGRAERLLGCIEEREGVYEVMRVNDGFEWRIFMSLDDAIGDLTALARTPATGSPTDTFAQLL